MPRFSVGEFAIKKGESEFLFRPSFSALDKLGDPDAIMQAFVDIQLADPDRPKWREIALALDIMQSCSDIKLADFFGYMIESKGKPKFKYKGVPAHDLIIFARHLIINGVYGKPSKTPSENSKSKEDDGFKPIEFVSFAVEHLNVSISEAWDLTMIEFQRLHDSKFPQEKQEKGMTADDIDALEEAIKKKRAK